MMHLPYLMLIMVLEVEVVWAIRITLLLYLEIHSLFKLEFEVAN